MLSFHYNSKRLQEFSNIDHVCLYISQNQLMHTKDTLPSSVSVPPKSQSSTVNSGNLSLSSNGGNLHAIPS